MYKAFFIWAVGPFTAVMMTLGYVMTPAHGGYKAMQIAESCRNPRVESVIDGAKIHKCKRASK